MRALNKVEEVACVTPIRSARVPIVKFVHRATGIRSDIRYVRTIRGPAGRGGRGSQLRPLSTWSMFYTSFKNRLSVMNTEFIKFVVQRLDQRIYPLTMTLRWVLSTIFSHSPGWLSFVTIALNQVLGDGSGPLRWRKKPQIHELRLRHADLFLPPD